MFKERPARVTVIQSDEAVTASLDVASAEPMQRRVTIVGVMQNPKRDGDVVRIFRLVSKKIGDLKLDVQSENPCGPAGSLYCDIVKINAGNMAPVVIGCSDAGPSGTTTDVENGRSLVQMRRQYRVCRKLINRPYLSRMVLRGSPIIERKISIECQDVGAGGDNRIAGSFEVIRHSERFFPGGCEKGPATGMNCPFGLRVAATSLTDAFAAATR